MKKTKKATRKDFYMEIRKSPGRFLSILFIVALGVAFFSGIRASEPDMRLSGDSYFDGTGLMDVKALCTYGVTEDDIRKMKEEDGVAYEEGAYSADFLYNTSDEQQVLHVMSLQEKLNQVTVSKGRLPKKSGECMADDSSAFQIGDEIRLESGTDDAVTDTLKTDTLTVVGLGNSPCYLSYGRGSTTVGDGNISAFLVLPEETFDMDVYTEVYLQVEGAKELTAFTDAYEDLIEKVMDRIEDLAMKRAVSRRNELRDEANEKLDEAREELEQGRADAAKELAEAAKEIADAEIRLADARAQIADGRVKIVNAKSTLNSKQRELDNAWADYQSGLAQWEEGAAAYEQGRQQYEEARAEAEAQMQEGLELLEGLKAQIDADEQNYEILQEQIAKLKAQIEALMAQAGGSMNQGTQQRYLPPEPETGGEGQPQPDQPDSGQEGSEGDGEEPQPVPTPDPDPTPNPDPNPNPVLPGQNPQALI